MKMIKILTTLTILLMLMLAGNLSIAQVKVGSDANPGGAIEVDGRNGGALIPLYNLICCCDFKGRDSEVAADYFIYGTPTFVAIDNQK